MTDPRVAKMADVLVKYCLALKPGELAALKAEQTRLAAELDEPSRQRLQAEHAQQFGGTGVGLEELTAPHADLELALQRGVVQRQRRAVWRLWCGDRYHGAEARRGGAPAAGLRARDRRAFR